jgi:glycerophosphoryl diester phosphodiesterase
MRVHPLSVLRAPNGREVQLSVKGCVWSGECPENSLRAIEECLGAPVARAEVGISLLRDADFLVTGDTRLDGGTTGTGAVRDVTRAEASRLQCRWRGRVWEDRPPLLSQVIELLRSRPSPTVLELNARDVATWPWARVDQLARLLEPVRDRVVVSGCADWNLRRLAQSDSRIQLGFSPTLYLDWLPPDTPPEELNATAGAYGYLDCHLQARAREGPTSDYLWDRISGLMRVVPGAAEMHVRLSLFEHMQSDGLGDTAHRLHRLGLRVGLFTLDANTPQWEARLTNAVWAGADVISTNTPRQLAEAIIR